MYDALNCGINASSGPVIGSLHGGDRFASPRILETMAMTFESNPDLMLAYGDIRHTSRSGKPGAYYSGDGFRPGLLKWGFMPPTLRYIAAGNCLSGTVYTPPISWWPEILNGWPRPAQGG